MSHLYLSLGHLNIFQVLKQKNPTDFKYMYSYTLISTCLYELEGQVIESDVSSC